MTTCFISIREHNISSLKTYMMKMWTHFFKGPTYTLSLDLSTLNSSLSSRLELWCFQIMWGFWACFCDTSKTYRVYCKSQLGLSVLMVEWTMNTMRHSSANQNLSTSSLKYVRLFLVIRSTEDDSWIWVTLFSTSHSPLGELIFGVQVK